MASWATLKAAIADAIKTNGNKEITGQLLQNVLNNIVSSVGENSTFAGIATPATNPGVPDGNVFYLATEAGTYANFSGIEIAIGEAVILEWQGSWVKKISGFATQQQFSKLENKVGSFLINNTLTSNRNSNNINLNEPLDIKKGSILVIEVLDNNFDDSVAFFFHTTAGKFYQLNNEGKKQFYIYEDIKVDLYGFNVAQEQDGYIKAVFNIIEAEELKNTIFNKEIGINLFEYNISVGYIDLNGGILDNYLEGILTPIINVKEGDIYNYSGGFNAGDLSMIWGYNNNSGDKVKLLPSKQSNYYNEEIIIPPGIDYIIAWSNKDKTPNLVFKGSAKSNTFTKTRIGNNLYNYKSVIRNVYVAYNSGEELSVPGDIFGCSGFIPVKGNTEYYIKYGQQQLAFYDANKVYISGLAEVKNRYFTTPINCAYIRITVSLSENERQVLSEETIYLTDDSYQEGYQGLSVDEAHIISNNKKRIVVQRNGSNFNSIRELIESLNADIDNQYEVFVPKGRWHECDLKGKKYVDIVGEDMFDTIIYNDGTSTNIVPSDYIFGGNRPLNEIPQSQKHIIFVQDDLSISNVTLEANDCKYCAHLDNEYYKIAKFNKVIFIAKDNVNASIGIGINGGQNIEIASSILKIANNSQGIVCHNWNNQRRPSCIRVTDTLFDGCDFLLVDELGSEQNDAWYLTNCHSTKPNGGNIFYMVDYNSENKTYWVNSNGEKETDPQKVPYCIKLNTLGTNVAAFIPLVFTPTGVIARPKLEKYIVSENYLILDAENYNVGDVIIAHDGDYNDLDYKTLGVVQNIIDGKAYISLRGKSAYLNKSKIEGSVVDGQKIYVNSMKKLTTSKTERLLGILELIYDNALILVE